MWVPISFPNEWRRARALALAAALACGGDEPPASSDSAAPAPAPGASLATTPADTGCRKTGDWQPCSVLDRLEHAGLVVKALPDPARLPHFSVEGTTYETSRALIHVFLFADAASRERETAQLDPVTVAPRNGSYAWSDPAVLVTSNNLAAIVVSPNERQSERIQLALGAGLPATRSPP